MPAASPSPAAALPRCGPLLWLLLAVGCGPDQAPDDIEGMTAFGFAHLPDADPGSLETLGAKLEPWLDAHISQASAGFSVLPLTATDLAARGIAVQESTEVVGAMVGLDYSADLDAVTLGFVWPDQAALFSGVLAQERTELTDRDCFVARDCDEHHTRDAVHLDLGVLGIESEYTASMRFRHVVTDAGRAVGWGFVTPDQVVFNVDYLTVHQQYGFGWLSPRADGGTRAVQAVWMEGEVEGLSVGEDFQLQVAIDGMLTAAEELDVWARIGYLGASESGCPSFPCSWP